MQMPDNPAVTQHVAQIVPSALLLFDGLKRAYAARNDDEDSEEGDSDEEGIDSELLDSDEDEIDDEGQTYLESLEEKVNKATGAPFDIKATMEEEEDSDSDDDEYDGCEETSLEAYTTPLDEDDCPVDEYNVFKDVLGAIQGSNTGWYTQLTGHLSETQGKALGEVILLANQRVAASESKKIELQGGYQFAQATVPGAFNFGAPATSPFGK